MKAVIVGCGRVGALLATILDAAGNDVSIIDVSTLAFDRLASDFRGNAIRGNGTDEAVLRRAGTAGADVFLAMTEGDNRNVMSAQLATEVFEVSTVIAKINDPLRAEAYAELGIATLCRTTLMADAILEAIGLPSSGGPAVRAPEGHHPGDEEHPLAAQEAPPVSVARLTPANTPGSAAAGPTTGRTTAPTRTPVSSGRPLGAAASRNPMEGPPTTRAIPESSDDHARSRRRWRAGGFRHLTGEG
ncbi:MAG TPA: NAD-binding protein [Candidatus Saccharimonadales bacterium]|nr:NAD-binding protein [Candidatus Saccharimonadales bacterium]